MSRVRPVVPVCWDATERESSKRSLPCQGTGRAGGNWRGCRSGGTFAWGGAADAPADLEAGLRAPPVLHPLEDFREPGPGVETVDIEFESALEALERAEQVAASRMHRSLPRPENRPASGHRERIDRIGFE